MNARKSNTWLSALIAVCLALFTSLAAAPAAQAAAYGTLAVHNVAQTADGGTAILAGDTWSIAQVATADIPDGDVSRIAYTATDEFADWAGTDWLALDSDQRADLAAELADHAAEHDLYAASAVAGADGYASFGSWQIGLYLVVRTGIADANAAYTAAPMLVGVPTSEDGVVTYDVQIQPKYEWAARLRIRAEEIVSYTGGDSMHGEPFPSVRYRVLMNRTLRNLVGDEGVTGIDFTYRGGEPFSLTDVHATGDEDYVVIPELDNVFTYIGLDENGTTYQSADRRAESDGGHTATPVVLRTIADVMEVADDDRTGGMYDIGIDDLETLTASVDGQPVTVEYEPDTIKIRYVTDAEEVATNEKSITIPAISQRGFETGGADGLVGDFFAVAPTGTTFTTNNREELGIVGTTLGEDGSAEIALLSDTLLNRQNGASFEDTAHDMAEEFLASQGIRVEGRHWAYRYLDLVNANDGNAWMASSKGMDIYWPYPEGTGPQTRFRLVNFSDMYREYSIDGVESLGSAMRTSELSNVEITNTEYGIRFHVGTNNYGPFALSWLTDGSQDDEVPPLIPGLPEVPGLGQTGSAIMYAVLAGGVLAGAAWLLGAARRRRQTGEGE